MEGIDTNSDSLPFVEPKECIPSYSSTNPVLICDSPSLSTDITNTNEASPQAIQPTSAKWSRVHRAGTGDFKELLKPYEKLGGHLRPYGQMQIFHEALDECGLFDLNLTGKKFIWFKHYQNGGSVWERLDKAVCTAEWFSLFPAIKVRTLSCVSSDHSPIFSLSNGITAKKQKHWRFEQIWLENEGFHNTVTAAWRKVSWGPPMIEVMKKIENCQNHLRRWSRDSVCNISKSLLEKKKSLELAETAAVRGGSMEFFLQLKFEVNDLLRMEKKLWQQRAHDHWMVSGDKNTELKGPNGVMVSGEDKIAALAVGYYKNLFSSSTPDNIEVVVQHTQGVVSEEINSELISEFSKTEVELALQQMAPLKASGPDGMPPIFF
ncbi:uncharacterized protein LOC142616692 [Castanea sativa]|uniref:uncharacterized protein LOC142616692 n=1 Tax=Castanea sativa TaxID=21020 RepID=UPI003F64BDCA